MSSIQYKLLLWFILTVETALFVYLYFSFSHLQDLSFFQQNLLQLTNTFLVNVCLFLYKYSYTVYLVTSCMTLLLYAIFNVLMLKKLAEHELQQEAMRYDVLYANIIDDVEKCYVRQFSNEELNHFYKLVETNSTLREYLRIALEEYNKQPDLNIKDFVRQNETLKGVYEIVKDELNALYKHYQLQA